ncbi:MAG: beta-ketoacyl-[acyl-carrier-protein] synthase II, partial [Armatimonadota bacterium]|nr:beta-ketoacyl-[acyl-carrier-protein] synthase II [Armatimonadota bacterium]
VGGSDGSVTPFTLALICAPRLLPESDGSDADHISRPFDGERRGGILSEGAGVLVLEALEHALARRAHIYAEVLAHANNAEAHRMIEIADDGSFLERAMRLTLSRAGLLPTQVDYISAHGPSDGCDTQETRAIKRVFGAHAYRIAVSSIKSMIGNPFAAAGPLQAISTALALEHQQVPPTINYSTPDPECDLDYVPNKARVCRVRVALVNSHGFGGANHCIALSKWPWRRGKSPAPGFEE